MNRIALILAVVVAIPVSVFGFFGVLGCATPPDFEDSKSYLDTSTIKQGSASSEAREEFPIEVTKDDFAKTEFWSVSTSIIKSDTKPTHKDLLSFTVVLDHAEVSGSCILFVHGFFDDWLFVRNIQVAVGDAPPIIFEPVSTDRDVRQSGLVETLVFSCDVADLLVSNTNQKIRVRASGDKGSMTVTLPPGWVQSVGVMLDLNTPKGELGGTSGVDGGLKDSNNSQ